MPPVLKGHVKTSKKVQISQAAAASLVAQSMKSPAHSTMGAALRAARSAARKQQLALKPAKTPLGEGMLAGRVTKPGVKKDYVKRLTEFQNFAGSWRLADVPDGESEAAVKFDRALEIFTDRRYLVFLQAEYGDKPRAAFPTKNGVFDHSMVLDGTLWRWLA